MPTLQVDVTDLAVYPEGSELTFGCTFEWVNPTSNVVTLSCCQSFCTQASYTVPAASGGTPGTTSATLLDTPEFNFGDSGFTAPGMPHIVVGGGGIPGNARGREREVA
jgi:hypothetical protein